MTGGLETKFTGDSSGARQAADEIIKKFGDLSAKSERLKAALGDVNLTSSLTKEQFNALKAAAAGAEGNVEKLTKAKSSLRDVADQMDQRLGRAQIAMGGLSQAAGSAGGKVSDLVGGAADLAMSFATGGGLQLGLAAVGAGLAFLLKQMNDAEEAARKLDERWQKADETARKLRDAAGDTAKDLQLQTAIAKAMTGNASADTLTTARMTQEAKLNEIVRERASLQAQLAAAERDSFTRQAAHINELSKNGPLPLQQILQLEQKRVDLFKEQNGELLKQVATLGSAETKARANVDAAMELVRQQERAARAAEAFATALDVRTRKVLAAADAALGQSPSDLLGRELDNEQLAPAYTQEGVLNRFLEGIADRESDAIGKGEAAAYFAGLNEALARGANLSAGGDVGAIGFPRDVGRDMANALLGASGAAATFGMALRSGAAGLASWGTQLAASATTVVPQMLESIIPALGADLTGLLREVGGGLAGLPGEFGRGGAMLAGASGDVAAAFEAAAPGIAAGVGAALGALGGPLGSAVAGAVGTGMDLLVQSFQTLVIGPLHDIFLSGQFGQAIEHAVGAGQGAAGATVVGGVALAMLLGPLNALAIPITALAVPVAAVAYAFLDLSMKTKSFQNFTALMEDTFSTLITSLEPVWASLQPLAQVAHYFVTDLVLPLGAAFTNLVGGAGGLYDAFRWVGQAMGGFVEFVGSVTGNDSLRAAGAQFKSDMGKGWDQLMAESNERLARLIGATDENTAALDQFNAFTQNLPSGFKDLSGMEFAAAAPGDPRRLSDATSVYIGKYQGSQDFHVDAQRIKSYVHRGGISRGPTRTGRTHDVRN